MLKTIWTATYISYIYIILFFDLLIHWAKLYAFSLLFCQVSRPHVNNDVFLKEAVDRYKGFLYLIKRNKERSIRCFCVPTYDIDLIWHTHQLHPVSYCKDLDEVLGKILEHDDMDSDRSKGKKLDTGFSGTTKQWEGTFGTRYWKAGAMYRGSEPSPVTNVPFMPHISRKDAPLENDNQNIIQLPELKIVEVIPTLFFFINDVLQVLYLTQVWRTHILKLIGIDADPLGVVWI